MFIFEMANNHMGDIHHGKRMIHEFSSVAKEFSFNFAFKFQFRHIPSFIHPAYQNRTDIKYVKRFIDTILSLEEVKILKKDIEERGYLTICTPFDEISVDHVVKLNFDIIKIASCSFNDWPLLEKIAKTDKPIIASTAGATIEVIDNVVSFFHHREKQFALMHCVGEYPTSEDHLELNQIDFFKHRYPDVPIGYSTHEDPDNVDSVKIAVAKGAMIFEKHIAVETETYPKNAYSATPIQIKKWLESAQNAFQMAGVADQRKSFSEKEICDLRQFKRGVFLKKPVKTGDAITVENTFFAFPNSTDQLLANDMSKYTTFTAKRDLDINEPVFQDDVDQAEIREKVYAIVTEVRKILKKGNIIFPGQADLEISHHYGLDRFHQFGVTMITVVNREYCKKLIIMLPGQSHPEQFHKIKEETFIVLFGELSINIDGIEKQCKAGEAVTIQSGEKHSFTTKTGAVIEEISSTHLIDDSYYTDPKIMGNPHRKTFLTHWIDD